MGPGSPNTPPPDGARRQALIDALMGVPARVGSAFTNMAQQGLAANERFMQGEGADRPFLPSTDNGGRIGALASFLASNMALGGPAGSLGAGPSMARRASALPMDEASRMRRADEMFPIEAYHGTSHDIPAFFRGGDYEKNVAAGSRPTNSFDANMGVWSSSSPGVSAEYASQSAKNYRNDIFGDFNAASKETQAAVIDLMHKKGITNRHDFTGFLDDMKGGANDPLSNQVRAMLNVQDRNPVIYPLRLGGKYKEIDWGGKPHHDLQMYRAAQQAQQEGFDGLKVNNIIDTIESSGPPATSYLTFDPRNIRSRFAAFDPARRNEADLLAGYGPNPLAAALSAQPQE